MRVPSRSFALYLALCVATVALGLATRIVPTAFPQPVAVYGGDALWAAMVFWAGALVCPRWRTRNLALSAVGIAYVVEVSQLYHGAWIDAARATRLGALVLGQGFLWSDLVSYAVGVAVVATVDVILVRQRDSPRTD